MKMRWSPIIAIAAMAMCSPALAVRHRKPVARNVPVIALTFDDLPVHGPLPPGQTRVMLARRIIAALHRAGAPPAYGFINAKGTVDEAGSIDALTVWRAAGWPLGNHTWSHMDLDKVTIEDWEADMLKDEPVLADTMGNADWHWLRFPYLHIGDTPEKRQAIAAFLALHGYRVAEISFATDDWAYTEPYVRCAAAGDKNAITWMKRTYLANAKRHIEVAQTLSQRLYGRRVPMIALLHMGGFTAATMPELLAEMKKMRTHFVTLEQAEIDPAYAHVMEDSVDSGGTFFERIARARHIAEPNDAATPFDKLKSMCLNAKLNSPDIP